MSYDIVGLGEILIDFVATEPVSYLQTTAFQKCFGGAPMNTIVGVSRLGVSSGAITAVGDDPLGQFLIEELKRNKVDVSQVKIKIGKKTSLAFVANEPGTGERSFIFYRQPWIQVWQSCSPIQSRPRCRPSPPRKRSHSRPGQTPLGQP